MYKFFFTTLILMMISLQGFSQVPGSFGYQAVIRDSGGEIWANSPTMVRTTLFQQSVGGPIVYQGIHNTSTNEYGLINLKVGSPDTWISGSLYYAQWSTYPYFLRIEVDLGNGYVDMGSQQLLSVPSAMTAQHAVSATQLVGFEIEGAQDGQVIMWDGNNEIWEPSFVQSDWSTDGTNAWRLDGNIGLGTNSPITGLHLHNKNGLRLSKTFTGSTILDGFYLGHDSFNNGNLYLTNYENADFVFSTNLAERLRITGSGNIGIGTSLPTAPLHIANLNNGGTAFSKWSVLQTGHTANDGSQIGVNASGEMVIEQKENLNILLTRNGSTKITVNSTGADVNGTLSSDEVNTGMVNAFGANLTNVEAYTTNTQFLYVDATAGTGNRPLFVNQDGQVYAGASATQYISVPGCAFYQWGAGYSSEQGAFGHTYTIWGEWGGALAPVDLPHGAVITPVSVGFDESSVEEHTVQLEPTSGCKNHFNGSIYRFIDGDRCTSSGGVGISTVTDTSIDHSICRGDSVYTYYLSMGTVGSDNVANTNLDFEPGVRIAYTLP
jgi:hypothetical protein